MDINISKIEEYKFPNYGLRILKLNEHIDMESLSNLIYEIAKFLYFFGLENVKNWEKFIKILKGDSEIGKYYFEKMPQWIQNEITKYDQPISDFEDIFKKNLINSINYYLIETSENLYKNPLFDNIVEKIRNVKFQEKQLINELSDTIIELENHKKNIIQELKDLYLEVIHNKINDENKYSNQLVNLKLIIKKIENIKISEQFLDNINLKEKDKRMIELNKKKEKLINELEEIKIMFNLDTILTTDQLNFKVNKVFNIINHLIDAIKKISFLEIDEEIETKKQLLATIELLENKKEKEEMENKLELFGLNRYLIQKSLKGIWCDIPYKTIIDFSKTNYIISRVISVLILNNRYFKKNGGIVKYSVINNYVYELLALLELIDLIDHYDTLEDAIRSCFENNRIPIEISEGILKLEQNPVIKEELISEKYSDYSLNKSNNIDKNTISNNQNHKNLFKIISSIFKK